MGKATVFQFQIYDIITDHWKTSRRWGTLDAIESIAHAKVIFGTGFEVDNEVICSDIPGLTAIDFSPQLRAGFQTIVRQSN